MFFLSFPNCRTHQILDNQETKKKLIRIRPRRPTNLKIEGDFFHITEHADKFIKYLLEKRAELLRRPTTLKLEGEMERKTETSEKYIKYEILERPSLCKKLTQLHLEGDLDITTEKREKFVPFEIQKRPPLFKTSTQLHLEGDIILTPEYRHEYVNYGSLERPKPAIPVNHLKPGGIFEHVNNNGKPSEDTLHPAIPFLRDSDKKSLDELSRRAHKLSREHSCVRTDESHIGSSKRTSTYPNIIFTKASDSDVSRISTNLDFPNQSQERVISRRTVDIQSDMDFSRKGASPTKTYWSLDGKDGCVDSSKQSNKVLKQLRRIENDLEDVEVSNTNNPIAVFVKV